MTTTSDRAELWAALALCASDRAYEHACPIIDGVQHWDPVDRAAADRAAREFEAAAALWAVADPASARDCRTQAEAYRTGAVLADYPAPKATEPVEPSLADTLTALTAAVIAEHDAAMAATEATLARIKGLIAELAELD